MEAELISNRSHLDGIVISNSEQSTNLDQSINQIIERGGFIKYKIDKRSTIFKTVAAIWSDGGNYLGTLHEYDVKGRTKDGHKEINIFAKQIIKTGSHQVITLPNLFKNELFFYKELSKIFENIQEDANIPDGEKYKMVKVYDESNLEAIIMENMTKSGYTVYDRMEVMTWEFAKKSVKTLAKFHALSFVLRKKEPEYFETKLKSIKYPLKFEDAWIDMVKQSRNSVIDYVDEELRDKVEKAYSDLAFKYAEYQNEESIKDCLCHGDYKQNNILFKVTEDELQEVTPIDFQLIHFGCPIFDLLFFIFLGSDRDFRKAHMLNLKNMYYENLSNFLNYFNLDANLVYPRKIFEKVFKERLDYGLFVPLVFLPYHLKSNKHAPDINKDISKMKIQVDDRFKSRFNGIIQDFIEWGYI